MKPLQRELLRYTYYTFALSFENLCQVRCPVHPTTRHKFSKVLSVVAFYSTYTRAYTRALTFENLCLGIRACVTEPGAAHGGLRQGH